MPTITLVLPNEIEKHDYEVGQNLLQIVRGHEHDISAPCGGNGTCGKCKIKVKGHGIVTSCLFYPQDDLEVVMPTDNELSVLTHQYEHTRVLSLNPGELALNSPYPLGLAIDIGTTSIVFYWVNLITGGVLKTKGIANPQKKYGADVISRITFSTSPNGLQLLQRELIQAINAEIANYLKREQLTNDLVVKISISANTTMLHMLIGVDPLPLALAPYKAPFTAAVSKKASDLGIVIHPDAQIHLLPSISAFVGADIVAGITSLAPSPQYKNILFIDIGTNGEMALLTPDKNVCCATAAGPAFEGANISCGMGAFDGAISVYSAGTYSTVGNEKPIGICGSGLIDIIAYLLDQGVIASDGLLSEDYVLADADASGNGAKVVLSPLDVREVQLAKSAIFSGIKLMLQSLDVAIEDVDVVYLAGGFGNYLNPQSAIAIGLLAPEFNNKIITVGNTSGSGAVLHLQSESFNGLLDETVRKTEYLDLSKHPDFEVEFAMNMYF